MDDNRTGWRAVYRWTIGLFHPSRPLCHGEARRFRLAPQSRVPGNVPGEEGSGGRDGTVAHGTTYITTLRPEKNSCAHGRAVCRWLVGPQQQEFR